MATTVTGTKPLTKTGFGGGRRLAARTAMVRPSETGIDACAASAVVCAIAIASACGWRLPSILMMFTALSSAYIVRAASANDWQPLAMPRILLLSTALDLSQQRHAGSRAAKIERRGQQNS